MATGISEPSYIPNIETLTDYYYHSAHGNIVEENPIVESMSQMNEYTLPISSIDPGVTVTYKIKINAKMCHTKLPSDFTLIQKNQEQSFTNIRTDGYTDYLEIISVGPEIQKITVYNHNDEPKVFYDGSTKLSVPNIYFSYYDKEMYMGIKSLLKTTRKNKFIGETTQPLVQGASDTHSSLPSSSGFLIDSNKNNSLLDRVYELSKIRYKSKIFKKYLEQKKDFDVYKLNEMNLTIAITSLLDGETEITPKDIYIIEKYLTKFSDFSYELFDNIKIVVFNSSCLFSEDVTEIFDLFKEWSTFFSDMLVEGPLQESRDNKRLIEDVDKKIEEINKQIHNYQRDLNSINKMRSSLKKNGLIPFEVSGDTDNSEYIELKSDYEDFETSISNLQILIDTNKSKLEDFQEEKFKLIQKTERYEAQSNIVNKRQKAGRKTRKKIRSKHILKK